jgi:AcrR family transcriptional regulator
VSSQRMSPNDKNRERLKGIALGPAAMAQLDRVMAAEGGEAMTSRILDAALRQFETVGLRHATVLDIARAARLARKTIYRRFANKDALVEAVLLRELARVLGEVESVNGRFATMEDRLVESFVVGLRAARRHPLLNRVLNTEPEALPYLTTAAGTALGIIHAFLIDGLSRCKGDGAEPGFDEVVIAEVLLRFAHSYLLTRHIALKLNNDSQVRAFARQCLAAAGSTDVPVLRPTPRSSH